MSGSAPHAGLNDPSGVTRVILTGFRDGATEGLIEFGPAGPVYRFHQLPNFGDSPDEETRGFILCPLPARAMDDFVSVLAPYHQPRWPSWCPIWSFPDAAIEEEVTRQTWEIIATAERPAWVIVTDDCVGFSWFAAESRSPRTYSFDEWMDWVLGVLGLFLVLPLGFLFQFALWGLVGYACLPLLSVYLTAWVIAPSWTGDPASIWVRLGSALLAWTALGVAVWLTPEEMARSAIASPIVVGLCVVLDRFMPGSLHA